MRKTGIPKKSGRPKAKSLEGRGTRIRPDHGNDLANTAFFQLRENIPFLSPALILQAVRDNPSISISDLVDRLQKRLPNPEPHLPRMVSSALNELQEANLLIERDGALQATSQLQAVQSALQLSLTDLAKLHNGSLLLRPVFGLPPRGPDIPDVFVLMPSSAELRRVYDEHIKKAASLAKLTVARADDFFAGQARIADIWRATYHSNLVIADCTGRNPNVFYEIGIAHVVGKPTILIAQSIDDIPIDLRHWRYLLYDLTPRGMAKFTTELQSTLQEEHEKLHHINAYSWVAQPYSTVAEYLIQDSK